MILSTNVIESDNMNYPLKDILIVLPTNRCLELNSLHLCYECEKDNRKFKSAGSQYSSSEILFQSMPNLKC
jgi:hypothetical protein